MTETVDNETKARRNRLLLIYLIIAVVSLVGSIIARYTIFDTGVQWEVRVAVAAPLSGPDAAIGEAMRRGAELYAERFNLGSGTKGRKIVIDLLDEAKAGANIDEAVAVVGHWRNAALDAATPGYVATGLPLIGLAPGSSEQAETHPGLFSIVYSNRHEARFLANYVHNVLGQKLVTIVHDATPAGTGMADAFEEIFLRFGTRIANRHDLSTIAADPQQAIPLLVTRLEEQHDPGMIFLALGPADAALFIRELRDRRLRNPVIGPDTLASNAFSELFTAEERAKYLNATLFSSPLLFDTANAAAQEFRSGYWEAHQTGPDWIAAHTYEALHLVVTALERTDDGRGTGISDLRRSIRDFLAATGSRPGGGIAGITGTTAFNERRNAEPAVRIGQYEGADRVSALTQLQPLRQANVASYIEEIKQGRMLYVNDRFMYKTNVVYTGVTVHRISALDLEQDSFELDFSIWFRYRGERFDPAELEFLNALEPVTLGEPMEESLNREMHFKLYRATGRFRFDFQAVDRPYGSHVGGLAFHHRSLNQNNLIYVVDVLGLGLEGGGSLKAQLEEGRAMESGWLLDRAWIAQEVFRTSTFGKPEYVGYGAVEPEYSRIDLGMLVRASKFSAREWIPGEYFLYLAITALIGSIFALGIDLNSSHPWWRAASFFMRVLFWPLFVLGVGNLALDLAIASRLSDHYVRLLEMLYLMWWWVVPSHLAMLAMERFVWKPLEARTQRIVPNVIRMFVAVLLYSVAILGIIAFVLDQKLTSLLASGGLFAMIVGLAIKANIDNVFSGIVINVERPFRIGDWIAVGGGKPAEVINITWRTLRLRNNAGEIISIPNAKVSDETIVNFSTHHDVRCEINIFVPLSVPPKQVMSRVNRFLEERDTIPRNVKPPKIVFAGMMNHYGVWAGRYRLFYFLDDYQKRAKIENASWKELWEYLQRDGIMLLAGDREIEAEPKDVTPQPAGGVA